MTAPAVELQGVTLAPGGRTVLDRVTLAVPAGRFVGVLGPNGAGKTTLFRAILGLLRPAAGSIRVLGAPASPGGASIGYVPQVRTQPAGARLRGWDFVAGAAGGARWGLPRLGVAGRAAVLDALDRVDARALADRPLLSLSGGERQRLLLAQALLDHPRLLLLDEPMAGLDPRHAAGVVALARQVGQELGITVLFSAHELNPLLGALDEVLYLARGAATIGPVDEVVTTPVLSRLYGAPIEVVRAAGQVFVMSGGSPAAGVCGPGHLHETHVHV